MKKKCAYWMLLSGVVLFFNSCETDDIEPKVTVSLSTNQISISEALGTTSVIATLNASSSQAVSVDLLAAGTAQNNNDYTLSSANITIPAGNLSASITLTAVQDTLEEGNESADISISSISGAIAIGTQQVAITIEDDDVAATPQIIVNEILYDPASGSDGDANKDGIRSASEDEFIEFINTSTQPIDLSGYKIYDAAALTSGTPRHVIPANTILPAGGVLLVFGGGTPTGNFGGAMVQTSTTGNMNLSNSGDVMTLTNTADSAIVSFDIEPLSNNPDESYTRNPDITGEFEQHNENTSVLFSPGTKIDGTSF